MFEINDPEALKRLLPEICDKESSQDPEGWTKENPLWGHCAIVSLMAQNLFGGELLRASLAHVPGFGPRASHYVNRLPSGIVDFTADQFGNRYPENLEFVARERSYVLSYPETAKRYKLLTLRLAKAVNHENPIFDDPIYQKCFFAALDSPCQKRKFGCVITCNEKIVYEGCNNMIEPLKSMCEPKCIRLSIQSRTESMLGACGHAEEGGLWKVIHDGIPIHGCELYVAGLQYNCLPSFKKTDDFTCLRCAVQMYNAHLKTIYAPVINRWVGIAPEKALKTARAYATREKAV